MCPNGVFSMQIMYWNTQKQARTRYEYMTMHCKGYFKYNDSQALSKNRAGMGVGKLTHWGRGCQCWPWKAAHAEDRIPVSHMDTCNGACSAGKLFLCLLNKMKMKIFS